MCYSCNRNVLKTSHYISEAYAWFGAAYFFYDIWSMYKIYTAKIIGTQINGDVCRTKTLSRFSRVITFLKKNFLMVGHHIFIGCFGFLVITVSSTINLKKKYYYLGHKYCNFYTSILKVCKLSMNVWNFVVEQVKGNNVLLSGLYK